MSIFIKNVEMPACCDKCFALDDHGDYPHCLITGDWRGYKFRTREKRMDTCPLVEVEPVRRGKWVHDGYDIPHGVDWMHCSECGNREPYVPAAMTNYCPICGAKMEA